MKTERNRWLGRLRVVAVYLFVALLLLAGRPTPQSVSIGFAFVAVGEALRLWAAGHLTKTVRLVTNGPYAHVRHPLYLGRLLILTGVVVMVRLPFAGSWWVLAISYLVFVGYYMRRKERVEPQRLEQHHGEPYRRYHAAVRPLWPRWTPYTAGPRTPWSSDALLRNREHWMVVFLTAVALLLLWRAYALPAA